MGAQLVVPLVVVALDGGLFEGAVHALDLAIGPRVVHLGQPVLDAMLVAHAVEDILAVVDVARAVGELDGIVGQHRMDAKGHGLGQVALELGRLHLACAFDQAGHGELAGAVDGDEQAQLALSRADFGDVEVKVADRVGFETYPSAEGRLGLSLLLP